jgi:hypothetical protein
MRNGFFGRFMCARALGGYILSGRPPIRCNLQYIPTLFKFMISCSVYARSHFIDEGIGPQLSIAVAL